MSTPSNKKVSVPITISERLRALRAKHGLTQEEFAQNLKVTRSYVSQIEAGIKQPGPKFLRKIATCEHTPEPVKFNLGEEDDPPALNERAGSYGKIKTREIPLISWAQAGFATAFEEMPFDDENTIPAAITNKEAFAVQLRGDSMEPKFSDGDVAIVLKDVPARNGDLVIANIKDQGCTFKLMHLVGGDTKKIRLSPYNPVYPALDFSNEDFHWLYPVHSVNKLVRR